MNKIKLRRLKKSLFGNKIKILLILVVSISLLMGTGYALSKTSLFFSGGAKIVIDEVVTCESDVTGSFELVFTYPGQEGQTHYIYDLIINNNGSEDILNWVVKIKGPNDLEILVNADVVEEGDGSFTLTPYSWNATVAAGATLTLQIGLATVEEDVSLEQLTFNGCAIIGEGDTTPDLPIDPEEPEEPVDPEEPEEPELTLESLTINPSEYTMTIGEIIPLQVTKEPSDIDVELLWDSSDQTIASVDENGSVTALSAGNTTITVSSGDISATCLITVTENVSPPSSDSLDIQFEHTYAYGTQIQMKITMTNISETVLSNFSFDLDMPEGTTYSLWSNPGVTIIDNTFNVSLWSALETNQSTEVTGLITLPDGYDASDYLTPSITNVLIN